MSEPVISIQAKYLPFLAQFIAKADIRRYLCGFHAEPSKDGGALLVGTNGHVLCVIHDELAVVSEKQIRPISAAMVSMAKKRIKDLKPVIRFAHFSDSAVFIEQAEMSAPTEIGEGTLLAEANKSIDGTFPDWRKVVKAAPKPEVGPVGVNVKYLGILSKLESGPWGCAEVRTTTESGVLILRLNAVPEFFGLVMPMRTEFLPAIPDWLRIPKPRKAAKKKAAKTA